MVYVLENIEGKGQYLAKDFNAAFESELASGDVTEVENALQFDDVHDLMTFSSESKGHKIMMKINFGTDAIVTNDIDEILANYRPKELKR